MIKKIVTSATFLLGLASTASAQVLTPVVGTTTPGLPTTGVNVDAFWATLTILFAIFMVVAGLVYVGTRRT